MAFVILGVILLLLKYLEVDPVAAWSWLWVLSPFAGAAVWWAWADKSGYTQRKAMEAMDAKKEARRQRAMEATGQVDPRKRKR
ncbi:small Trp-rich protein [Inhella inkyongensis]|uniref:Small Trp-rich protein n=1 Tax=Inhella inkyongensis TaxID=392593 RepID=A0A840SAP3_9BURK|nr:TIGR04438 family Trp-rich protein [Inhella inkyongensis]MBB5206086.1 small Trp-rich protein [Inhella inkyongensis]